MWISEDKYNQLIEQAENRETVERLEKRIDILNQDHDREMSNFKQDVKVTLDRKDAEVDTKVHDATKAANESIHKLTIEKNNAVQKAEILEKAFENLGFDVKDMKDILNKLVDGIVSKNQVQLIQGK